MSQAERAAEIWVGAKLDSYRTVKSLRMATDAVVMLRRGGYTWAGIKAYMQAATLLNSN